MPRLQRRSPVFKNLALFKLFPPAQVPRLVWLTAGWVCPDGLQSLPAVGVKRFKESEKELAKRSNPEKTSEMHTTEKR